MVYMSVTFLLPSAIGLIWMWWANYAFCVRTIVQERQLKRTFSGSRTDVRVVNSNTATRTGGLVLRGQEKTHARTLEVIGT